MISNIACMNFKEWTYSLPSCLFPTVSPCFMLAPSIHQLPKSEFYLSTLYSLIFSFQNIKSTYLHNSPMLLHLFRHPAFPLGPLQLFAECSSWHHPCSSPFNCHSTFKRIFLNLSKPHFVIALLKTP